MRIPAPAPLKKLADVKCDESLVVDDKHQASVKLA